MKKEDFQKLKAIVEDNGFVMLNESENENEKFAVIVLKKDPLVKVKFVDDSIDDFGDFEDHGFVFRIPKFKIKPEDKIGEYLAKKLEKYLNNKTK